MTKKPVAKKVKKPIAKKVEATVPTEAVTTTEASTPNATSAVTTLAAAAEYNIPMTYTQPLSHMDYAVNFIRRAWKRFERKLPRLVWYGQEVDVLITFTEHKFAPLFAEARFDLPLTTPTLAIETVPAPDPIAEATRHLLTAGIGFDTGIGPRGRDWFFDYSLTGPVRVKFLGKTKYPFVRQE